MESGYPKFLNVESEQWFFHWLRFKLTSCPIGGECSTCLCVRDNLEHGTLMLLDALFDIHHKLTAGSNIVAINAGHMTRAKARDILVTTKYVPGSQSRHSVARERFVAKLREDFPGVDVAALPADVSVYAPLMGKGGNALYHILSLLYNASIGKSTAAVDVPSNVSVIAFCLLCFHLSKQYYLTAGVVDYMWSETLAFNCITTLYKAEESVLDRLIRTLHDI